MSEGNRHDDIQGEIIHVYDGIEEADNELPLWWLFTFYGAIVFAVFYWFYYEGFEVGPSPMQAYAAELREAASAGGEVNDALIEALALDSSAVAAGQAHFQAQCVVCHREDAGGNIGPNLTDPNWIHGGSPQQIHDTIRDGAMSASGAMPAWGASLGPTAVQQLAAYVVTLRNTNVEGKEPQGEVWSPEAAEGAGDDADADTEADADADDAEPAEGAGAAAAAEGAVDAVDAEPSDDAADSEGAVDDTAPADEAAEPEPAEAEGE